jgi:Family of unknown function (DUF5331)
MNIQHLRESLKIKWLDYYSENRPWLVKMQIWGTYDGERRPSSGFMLATLSVLEPQLDQIFPFILDLNNNPDRIVAALGLNFNPDQHLDLIKSENPIYTTEVKSDRVAPPVAQPCFQEGCSVSQQHTGDRQSFVIDAIKNDVESKSNPEPLAVATKIESKDKPKRSLGFTSKVETKGKQARSPNFTTDSNKSRQGRSLAVIGEAKSKGLHSKTLPPNLSPWRGEKKKSVAPLPGDVIRMNPTCERSLVVSKQLSSNGKPLVVATKIESQDKRVKMQLKDVQSEVNSSSKTNASSLASWIDEFCEGAD